MAIRELHHVSTKTPGTQSRGIGDDGDGGTSVGGIRSSIRVPARHVPDTAALHVDQLGGSSRHLLLPEASGVAVAEGFD
jgi:hypothetical protein